MSLYSKILFPSLQGSAIVWSKTLTPGTNMRAGQLNIPGLKTKTPSTTKPKKKPFKIPIDMKTP